MRDLLKADRYLTTAEACQLLAVSEKTLQNWRRRGKIEGHRMGWRTIRYSPAEIRRVLKKGVYYARSSKS